MFRRLLILLSLLLALPATAQPRCHDGVAAASHVAVAHGMAGMEMSDGGSSHRGDAAHPAGHDCLGCIPPDMLIGARIAATSGARTPPVAASLPAFAPGAASAPTPPPPKHA